MTERRSYVAGRWIEGDEILAVENPADETQVAELSITPLPEFARAIAEARRAFDEGPWSTMPRSERATRVLALIDEIEARAETLVPTMVAEAGQPTMFAEGMQLRSGTTLARNLVDLYLAIAGEAANPVPVDALVANRVALSVLRHEPMGVVSAITPYNAAILMAFQKVIPALVTGNTVILRPSPLTPMSSLVFGQAAAAAGVPAGVLSVVIEEGAGGAELLTTDPAIDMVSFTGSTAVGKRILAQAAPTVKQVTLELGGKSPQIYLPDAIDKVA